MKLLNKIISLLDKKDKNYLLILLIFSIFISLLETIGIGIIMPFINVATNFNEVLNNEIYLKIYNFFGFETPKSFVVTFGIGLIFFYLFRSIINSVYFYFLAKFAQGRYYVFANKLFHKYLNLDYFTFTKKNSSLMTKTIITEAQNLSLFLANLLFLISEFIVASMIYLFLLWIDWKVTLGLTLFLGINVFLITQVISKRIKKAGEQRDIYQSNFYKLLNNVFGDFKILKLRQNIDEVFIKFQDYTNGFAKVNILHSVFSQIPRLYLEAVAFSLISFLIVMMILLNNGDISNSLNMITMFLLGLFRLMPSMNRMLSSYNNMLFYSKSLDLIFDDLNLKEEKLNNKEINFNNSINIKNLNFFYDEKQVLKDINLEIKKGDKVAFVGESGSGKTTLVDIIIGIHKAPKNTLFVDNIELNSSNLKNWRKKIGYIPQHLYLFDGTVAENIALEEEFDEKRVIEVLKKAQIYQFLETHHNGIYTQVGEGGAKLSGGQKQRIAIARALYNEPEILVLDEATSALDENIEKEIMKEIYKVSSDKTLIIIAHRLSTIKGCTSIYELKNGSSDKIL